MNDIQEKIDKLLQTIKKSTAREFLINIRTAYENYGRLTEGQMLALEKFWENRDRSKLRKLGLE